MNTNCSPIWPVTSVRVTADGRLLPPGGGGGGGVLSGSFRRIKVAGRFNEIVVPESDSPHPHFPAPEKAAKGITLAYPFYITGFILDILCLSFTELHL
jgi:hypothetical protein